MEVKQVDDYSGFNEYVARHPHGSVLQTTNWGQLKETTGWEWHPLAVFDGGKIAASALVLARPLKGLGIHILYSPRGPLFSSLEALNKLQSGVRELGTKTGLCLEGDPALPQRISDGRSSSRSKG